MFNIDLNLDEYIQNFASGLGDRNEARVAVMNQQVAVHEI